MQYDISAEIKDLKCNTINFWTNILPWDCVDVETWGKICCKIINKLYL